jgi:uncharacterized protein
MAESRPDLSNGLPVFPLGGVTLLPHTRFPLHVFEQRYRNLINDILKRPQTEHCFAMGTLIEPGTTELALGMPPVFPVAGVGRVTEYSRLPDGRFMLILEGIGRVRLHAEHTLHNGYRVFHAEWIRDIQPPLGNPMEAELTQELRDIALTLLKGQEEQFKPLLHNELRLAALTDIMVGYLPFRAEFKLEQLSEPNVLQRAARCIAELEQMLGGTPARPVKPDDPVSMN